MSQSIGGVVLAGARNDGALRECSSEAYEALVPLRGRPLVEYVMDALHESKRVQEFAVVGFPEFRERLSMGDVPLLPAGDSFIESIRTGLSCYPDAEYLFFITADVPLMSGARVDAFIEQALGHSGEFFVPIVTRATSTAKYPTIERTYARLQGEDLTLGNCFLGTAACIERILPRLETMYRLRKSVFRLAWAVGPMLLLRMATRTATLAQVEATFQRLIGAEGRAILSDHPEIALDVDKPSHLRALEALDWPEE